MSNNNKTDYGELFCEAIDTIVAERLNAVTKDVTVLCTVVDDSKRQEGKYVVTETNSQTKFEAFSDNTEYRKDNNVYVTIPKGDMNEAKFIIGKKQKDELEEAYTYTRPFDTIVDVSSNLITAEIPIEKTGLVANNDEPHAITLWSYNLDSSAIIADTGESLKSYTRLGIKGEFRSWLNQFYVNVNGKSVAAGVKEGSYGLRLRLKTINENIVEKEDEEGYYDLYLDAKDMNGNPYNFSTFYSQEKVFNIENVGKIIAMELQFYEEPGSFVNNINGEPVPHTDFLGHTLNPNLFVKDCYVCIGYDVETFEDDQVMLYTLDNGSYRPNATNLENQKLIQLRWVNDFGNKIKVVQATDNLNADIRWYKYQLGAPSPDRYAGYHWVRIDEAEINNNFSYLFTPNITLQEERIKVIILYEEDVLRSNTLIFDNEIEVPSQPTVNALSAAEIVTLDASEGNYFIYDIGNSIKNYADSAEVKELDLYFNGAQLTIANEIEWLIPTKDTMIILDNDFKGDTFDETSMPGWCKITRKGSGEKGDDITGLTKQKYRIKSYWSQDDVNNTIYCTVKQYGIDYPAVREFSFGPSGTSGTDCTLTLDFEDGVTALTIGNPQAVIARARLYDYNNKVVDLSQYELEWKVTSGLTDNEGTKVDDLIPVDGRNDAVELKLDTSINTVPTDNYDILQVTVTNFGDYELTAYLPLPIKKDTTYKYIEGATKLIYNSIGNIDNYYKDPYKLYRADGENISSTFGVWTINNGVANDNNYLPQLIISTDKLTGVPTYSLQATNVYVPETCTKVNVTGSDENGNVIWSQPLLIMQNRYPSAMVNKWDGSLTINKTNNAILAAKMVAGRKEDDNTFSGVMMGDWYGEDIEDVIANHTGLYGFNYGKASFGFRDDGTAFIGKPGSGRIEFNGNEGQITSNSYEYGAGGIKIDLDDGILYAQSPNNTIDDSELNTGMRKGYLTINASHTTTPLSIGDEEDGGRSNYFYVDWDGTFKATTGYIGPWQLDADGFTNGEEGEDKIYLYANGTMVMGTGADRIKLESGRITIGNNSSANRIILSSGTDTTPAGILIGPTKNQIQIGDAAITMGNFNESSTSSRIKIDSSSIQMGEYDSDTEEFGNNTLINDEGITVTCPSDDGQTQYTTISYNGVSSTEFIVLEYTGQAAGEGNVAGGLRYGYTNYGNDNDDILGVELYSANYSDRRPQDGSIFKVTDYHIAGTTYESQMILDEEKAVIGMITGQSGLTGKSGSVRCDADGLTLRGGVINFSNVTEINFTNTDEVTIDFSNVYAKNLYAVLA